MPASLKLASTFKDDLAVIFIEAQGLAQDQAEAFAYGKGWMGSSAMWTTERPCNSGSRGLPNFVLLSSEGKVLIKGNSARYESVIEDLVKKDVSRSKKGPEGVPKSLKKMWGDFGKGRYAAAFRAVEKLAETGNADAEAAKETLEVFRERIDSRIHRAARMVESGYLLEAEEYIGSLAKSLHGLEAYEAEVSELGDRLGSPEMKAKMAAAKAFAKIEKVIHKNGLDAKTVKLLRKFVSKQEGTKAAKRAEHLAVLAESKV